MNPENYAWLVLFLPLLAAVSITLFTQKDARLSAQFSLWAVTLSFLASLTFLLLLRDGQAVDLAMNWLSVGPLRIDMGLHLDRLSVLMLLIVTGVGGVIHYYSYGYMTGDPGFSRYFASLSFFTFSMLGIVLANNFVQMFIFWELVGLSSYLLIGFWYQRPAAADAAKKAFLTNRLGDFGFLVGIILVWAVLGSVRFGELQEKLSQNPELLGSMATVAGLLIFCGAVGKSAQFPLHVWLPDAMEGPTPVSALIHAATMVAAGVYMLCRVFFLLNIPQHWPSALSFLEGISALGVVAWIGGITSLLAALIAVQQNDIKRILAYSTLSQLGYMVMAVGCGGPPAAMYHLTTHAFFKALLFLGAGSVILALHHEQDIWKMGGLRSRMPVTWWTFLFATLALCGIWPFSGFYSKDDVLTTAYHSRVGLFVVGVLVAVLTTFYMFRLLFVAFLGRERSDAAEHAKESPAIITAPLVLLAVPTVLAGWWGIDRFIVPQFGGEVVEPLSWTQQLFLPFSHAPFSAFFGILAVVVGFTVAWSLYARAARDPLPEAWGWFARAMRNRFYFDEIYAALIAMTQDALARLAAWIDRWVVAGFMVKGTHGTTEILGRALRLFQTGNLQTYAFLVAAGVALVLYVVLLS